jgi:hypothetical protein
MTLFEKLRLGLVFSRAAAGKPSPKDKHTMNDLIKKYAGSSIRHGLTVAAGFLTAKGLPSLSEGSIENLTDISIAGALFLVALVWSFVEKKLTAKKIDAAAK